MYQSAVVTLCLLMMYCTFLCHVRLCVTLALVTLYAVVVAGQKQKTKVIKDSDAPEWNEVCYPYTMFYTCRSQ